MHVAYASQIDSCMLGSWYSRGVGLSTNKEQVFTNERGPPGGIFLVDGRPDQR